MKSGPSTRTDIAWGGSFDDALLLVGGAGQAGVRNAANGELLWSSRSRFGGATRYREFVLLHGDGGIEMRHPSTGALFTTLAVPDGYESPLALRGSAYIVKNGVDATAVDLSSGNILWRRPLVEDMRQRLELTSGPREVRATPGSRSSVLVAFFAGATFAVSTHDGSILWHQPNVWCPDAWPTVHDGRVHAFWGSHLWALDEDTGTVIYEVEVPAGLKTYRERPGTVFAGRLAIAHESGLLAIFNAEDGTLVTYYQAKVPLWRTEELDGRLLAATGDGTLLVFDRSIWGVD